MNSRRIGCVAALLLWLSASPLVAQRPPDMAGLAAALSQNPAQVKAQYTQALEEYRKKKDGHGEAVTLMMLGLTELALDNPDGCRTNLQESSKKMEALHDVVGQWMTIIVLAQLDQALGNSQQAVAGMEKAFTVIDKAKTSREPFSLKTLAMLGAASGIPPEMLAMLEQSADLIKPVLLQSLEPVTHDLYGSMLTQAGQLEKAEAELNAAAAGSQQLQGMYDFSIAAHFGDLRFRQKRYDEARAQYKKALSGTAQIPMNPMGDQFLKVGIYDKLALLEAITGNRAEAIRWNDKSLEIVRGAGLKVQECVTLETRGQLLMRTERFAEAEAAFQQAMKIAEALKSGARQAAIESHLGTLQLTSGNYGKAATHLERSVQLYGSLKDPISEAATWGSLANAYMLTDNIPAAEQALVRARELVAKNRFPLGVDMIAMSETWLRFRKGQATSSEVKASVEKFMRNAESVNIDIAQDVEQIMRETMEVLESGKFPGKPQARSAIPMFDTYQRVARGMRLIQQGDFERARNVWREALEKNASSDMRVSLLAMIGASYWREGNIEEASRWFAESTEVLDAMGSGLPPSMFTEFYGSYHRAYYEVSIETLLQAGKIGEAFQTTERARARAFLRLLGNHRLSAPAGSELAAEVARVRQMIDNWDAKPQPGLRLVDLRRRYAVLQTRLQAAEAEYASMTSVQPLSLAAVQKELPDDTTLVSYFVTLFGAHAWVIDRDSVEWVRLEMSPPQMRRITCWAFELAKPRSGRPGDDECVVDPANAEEAYAALVAPLRGRIRKDRLMIVPHADLHYVPFAALYDPEHKKYLVEDYPISYIPSASTLRFLRAKDSSVERRALVLGDPTATAQTRLDGAKIEAEAVAAKFGTRAHLGGAATERLLHDLGDGKFDLLHIAAHATYDPINPLFSAIHLAEGGQQDGELSVDEIQSKIDLEDVNLVVLSACRSGIGNRSGGDEITGLTRAILYAGSPRVLSTLWNISDEATPPLIEKFYDRLLAGASPADALRVAQTELLRGNTKYADPRYWAAFVLTGDPTGNWKS